MFYSHNLLARKGPLGTVWCAAHLQNKLKKSNYITINIPATVEKIMYPEVPIALRMSGHLLLGVVRIYSKKVEYLQHDCNVLRIDINKAYTYADINLPADATQATFESITLPDNFALDALNLDEYNPEGSTDTHLRSQDDISLPDRSPTISSKAKDQIPAGYFLISISEDIQNNPSQAEDDAGSRPMPMQEDPQPSTPPETAAGSQDPAPSNQMGFIENTSNEDSVPEIEIMRDARHSDLHYSPPILPTILPDREEPDLVLAEEIVKEKEIGTPPLVEMVVPGEQSLPSKQNQPSDSAPLESPFGNSDPHISFASPEMVLRPSPLVEPAPAAEQQRVRRRKFYDEETVLTNAVCKNALEDSSNLLRKRKVDCSSLGIWKLSNKRKKDAVLVDPLMTGLCSNLCEMFKTDYISTKPHLVDTNEAHPDLDMDIEVARNFMGSGENNMMPILSPDNTTNIHSPDHTTHMRSPDHMSFPSPSRMADFTPEVSTGIGTQSYQAQTTFGTSAGQTLDPTSSVRSFPPEMETPMPDSNEHQGFGNNDLFDIPEMDSGELKFLEDDESPSAGLRGSPEPYTSARKTNSPPHLSARAKAVADYMHMKSSVTPSSSEAVRQDLSLNSILEGQKRKVCARMFYETLVLKSVDYIDVKQDEAYGDITIIPTPNLFQFVKKQKDLEK